MGWGDIKVNNDTNMNIDVPVDVDHMNVDINLDFIIYCYFDT